MSTAKRWPKLRPNTVLIAASIGARFGTMLQRRTMAPPGNYTRPGRSPRGRRQRQDRSQWPEAPPRSPSRRSRGGKDGGGKGRGFQRRCQGQVQKGCPSWCINWQVGWVAAGSTTTAGRSSLGSSNRPYCPSSSTPNSSLDCREFANEDFDVSPQERSARSFLRRFKRLCVVFNRTTASS